MSAPVVTTDVPVMINGRRAHVRCDGGLVVKFPRADSITVPIDDITGSVQCIGRIGVLLGDPRVIVPGTKLGVGSFIITWASTTNASDWERLIDMIHTVGECTDYRTVECVHSTCGRTEVQIAHPVVIWTSRTCTVVPSVEMAVLQRTKGGMSTFDIHLIPPNGKGPIVRIDMLPHSVMDQWDDLYPGCIIDGGADPLPPRLIQDAQVYGKASLMEAIDAVDCDMESDVGSVWGSGDSDDACSSSDSNVSGDESEDSEDSEDSDSSDASDASDASESSGTYV